MKSYVTVLAFLIAVIMYACGGMSSSLTDPNESPGEVAGKVDTGKDGGTGGGTGTGINGGAGGGDVYAILIDKDGNRKVSKTGADGEFSFSDVTSGDLTLILNDLHGQGAIRQMVVIGGGRNDIGSFTLSPLEKQPQIFDFTDIGFEEKITESYGDHLQSHFSSDASFAVSFQKLPGSTKHDIVRTDLADGSEKVLVKDEELAGDSYSTSWVVMDADVRGAGLMEDRFLLYYANREYEQDPKYQSQHVVSYDLTTGKSSVVPVDEGTTAFTKVAAERYCRETYPGDPNPQQCISFYVNTYFTDRGHHFTGGKFYYAQSVSQESFQMDNQGGFGMYVGEKVEFCKFNPASGARDCVAVNGYDAYTSFDGIKFGKDAAFTQMGKRPCDPTNVNDPMGSGCFGSYTVGAPIVAIKYKDLTKKTYASPEAMDYLLSPDQSTLVYTTPDRGAITTSLVKVDLATDKETVLAEAALGDINNPDQFRGPALSADGTHVGVIVAKGRYSSYSGTFLVANVAKKTTVSFDGKVAYKGKTLGTADQTASLLWNGCQGDYYGASCFSADGKHYLAQMYFAKDAYKTYFGVDLPAGQETIYLTLNMPVGGGQAFVTESKTGLTYPDYSAVPPAQSPDGTLTAEVVRVKDTGFNQLFVKEAGAVGGTQVTFITAQHGEFGWTADSRHVVYVTRDPVSGYNQFFRINPMSFIDPEHALAK